MDKSQIITIAVTAAITAAITVTVTLSLNGVAKLILAGVKNTITSEKNKQVLRKIFNARTRSIAWMSLMLLFDIFMLFSALHDTSPITRWVIFKISLYLMLSAACVITLLIEIIVFKDFKKL